MLHFIYTSDDSFAEQIQPDLPEKSRQEIVEMVRMMMKDFAFALSTKAFRKDVLSVDSGQVFVCEHLYETVVALEENRRGGLWHPDDLSRFLTKMKTYRKLFDKSHDLFFSRIQIWGKSVGDTRSKFYALQDLYTEEQKKTLPEDSIHQLRFQLLSQVFSNVPPPAPITSDDPTAVASKSMKLWTPDELEVLIQFLVDITLQVQKHGTSPLLPEVAAKLGRTEQSCVNKLQDMQERYTKKSTYYRAAHLPDIIFDKESVAHKIFNADWSNHDDPMLGWSVDTTFRVCEAMQANLSKYHEGRKAFYTPVADAIPDVPLTMLFVNGARILRLWEDRHGAVETFNPTGRSVVAPAGSIHEGHCTTNLSSTFDASRPIGKANTKTASMLLQNPRGAELNDGADDSAVEGSTPTPDHSSPDAFDFEGDDIGMTLTKGGPCT
ncbi:hypothetical protein P43SY_007180 [Pythium insidiosum]|uniref:Uncharacterized protein n=1 Tax=Pythium insidiosum TaxID=114742 RepID=A0AAD5LGB9_PYTIN|nr:hypothetical protein P43SY_007180 [Pythium insidiosum]